MMIRKGQHISRWELARSVTSSAGCNSCSNKTVTKSLPAAESRRRISDYRSNSSAMKGFLEALRDEDEEKTCSRFELIIKDGQLRKERAPKTESEH